MKLVIEYVKNDSRTHGIPYWRATVGDEGHTATGGDPLSALANLVMDQEATLDYHRENARDRPV